MEPTLLGIAGGSGGGKTTLANAIAEEADISLGAGAATVIELDRFYKPRADAVEQCITNFDEPHALDFELFSHVLRELIEQGETSVPIYDFALHDRVGSEKIKGGPLIVIEGILTLWDINARSQLHYSVFVETPDEERLKRRVSRDRVHRGRQEKEILEQWSESVLPMHEKYVEPTKAYADRVVDGRSDIVVIAREVLRPLLGIER